ncbi:MAG: hypothetical protein LBQ54_00255 [Planctomycetaceae bacterium]|jgi:hypothetical protein|nr:hypothetical protein [Planctomycetaceae bacterium]
MGKINFQDWASSSQIDPLLLELLQEKTDKAEQPEPVKPPVIVKFPVLIAAYIGMAMMILVILLGLLQGSEVDLILTNACHTLLIFYGVGYVVGKILDEVLHESSKAMLREMIRRAENRGNTSSPQNSNSEE